MKLVISLFILLPAISYAQLICNKNEKPANPEVSAITATNDVEAVVACPDCETLKAKGGEALLSFPRELYAQDEAQRLADYNLVKKYIKSNSSPEGLKSSIGRTQARLALYKACANNKWSKEAMVAFNDYLPNAKDHCSLSVFLPENEDIKRSVIALEPNKKPSRQGLNNFCHVLANVNFDGTIFTDWKRAYKERIPDLEIKIKRDEKKLAEITSSNKDTNIPDLGPDFASTGAIECDIKFDEYRAINRYTASFYKCLNQAMRGENDCISQDELHALVRIINRGLTKIAPHVGEVYRGIKSLPENVLAAHQEGAIIQFSSYLSTTAAKNRIFSGMYQYVIQSKTGRLVSPISNIPREEEVLFAPMAKFKITDIEENPKEENGKIFYLEEI